MELGTDYMAARQMWDDAPKEAVEGAMVHARSISHFYRQTDEQAYVSIIIESAAIAGVLFMRNTGLGRGWVDIDVDVYASNVSFLGEYHMQLRHLGAAEKILEELESHATTHPEWPLVAAAARLMLGKWAMVDKEVRA